MNHLFVPYTLALKLKGKGFNEPCFALFSCMEGENNKFIWATSSIAHVMEFHKKGNKFFNDTDVRIQNFIQNSFAENTVTAPLYQQVVDWFRDKHKIEVAASLFPIREFEDGRHGYRVGRGNNKGWNCWDEDIKTYYQALTKAIEKALTLIP